MFMSCIYETAYCLRYLPNTGPEKFMSIMDLNSHHTGNITAHGHQDVFQHCQWDIGESAKSGNLSSKRHCLGQDQGTPGFYSLIFLVPKKPSMKLNMKMFIALYLQDPPHFRIMSIRLHHTISTFKMRIYTYPSIGSTATSPSSFSKTTTANGSSSHLQCLWPRISKPIMKFLHIRGIIFEPYIDCCTSTIADQLLQIQTTSCNT